MPEWEDGMSVGVEAIDVRHRQLWRRIRHLAKAVAEGDAADVRSSLRSLHAHLSDQRAEEERWMDDAGYPGAREHARAHAAVLERIAAARADQGAGADRRLIEAAGRLARAIEEHMRSDDLKLGRFWTARENLRRLAEAAPGVGAVLTPIPGMLATAVVARPRRQDEEAVPAPVASPPPDR